MPEIGSNFKLLFAVGAVILVIGLLLTWYPSSVIGGLETRLSQIGLSTNERNADQGALNSWQIWQLTTFQPLSYIFIAVGIIVMVYSVIAEIFSIATSRRVVKKTEKE
jgi:hypothetical protein